MSANGQHAMELQRLNSRTLKDVFKRLDRNGDGLVPLKDINTVLRETHMVDELPPFSIRSIIRKADEDKNGHLDYDEFVKLVENHPSMFQRYLRTYVNTVVPRRPGDQTDLEYIEQYTCWPPPLCMLLISLVEIALYVYDCVRLQEFGAHTPVPIDSVLIYDPFKRYEAWRFFTYMFVHIGYIHLIFNLITQLLLGIPLEMVHRGWRVMLVYLAGVVAGSLGTSVSDPKVFLAGASGGVYAIITAHVATIIMNWSEMDFAGLQLGVFTLLGGMDIGVAVYERYFLGKDTQVGYAAHLAGAMAGLLVGINVLRNLNVKRWERWLWWISLILYIVLMLTAVIWNAAFPDYFPTPM